MPNYTFYCTKCGVYNVCQSIQEYTGKTKCPICRKKSQQRVYQEDMPAVSIRLATSEIKQLGHLAERNSENMTMDETIERTKINTEYKHKKNKPLPPGMSRIKKSDGSIDMDKLKINKRKSKNV
jgi:putative FmdB family regulatory protein